MWIKSKRKWLLLSLILLLAGFFTYLTLRSVNQYLDKEIEKIESKNYQPTTQRIVFNDNLMAGTIIEAENLAVRDFPIDYVPTDSYLPESFEDIRGYMLKYSVNAGDTVQPLHLQSANANQFSQRIQSGRRAMSISVDRINSISGLIRPGDLIDIYVSFDYQRRKVTAPLLQGVYVLATDQYTDDTTQTSSSFNTLTLDLSPDEAAKLVAAMHSAEITAMLRNPVDDHTSVMAVRNDIATLLGLRNPIENLNQGKKVNIIYGNTVQRDNLAPLRPKRIYRAPPAVFELHGIQQQLSHEPLFDESYASNYSMNHSLHP